MVDVGAVGVATNGVGKVEDEGVARRLRISGGCNHVGGLGDSQEGQARALDEGDTARLRNPKEEVGVEGIDMGQLRDPREGRQNAGRGEATEETAQAMEYGRISVLRDGAVLNSKSII